ncbi:PREDICTED: uncharacterized protein LOC109236376 [Nicotiana attenuata]|uniref:uncharacterized protein LOC109236376 n=1 Tax=Nicotiana attenuata TaxID=49451 RepID=UPI0009045DFF|nr:PREDICTED: uncharacterized protein LOC109236376 [Nicotiana attenuata]
MDADNASLEVWVMDPGCSDHLPLKISFIDKEESGLKPFKFLNHLADHEDFLEIVNKAWIGGWTGDKMKDVWEKLKRVKIAMKKLNAEEYNVVGGRIAKCREQLCILQEQMRKPGQPSTMTLAEKETKLQLEKWLRVEESILKQKSRIQWLKLGDGNNAYFYASMKNRNSQNKIQKLTRSNGTVTQTKQEMEDEVMSFYKQLLGTAAEKIPTINTTVMREGPMVNKQQQRQLIASVTKEEIHRALMGISDNKAP